jgi:hypothetical protein
MGLALVSAITALVPLLVLSILGTAALRERFEGPRPLVAGLGVLVLAVAAMLISPAAGWLTSVRGQWSAGMSYRWVLRTTATGGVLVGAYVFFAAAPGAPASQDSWAELIGAALGLWLGLMALALLGEGLLWGFVWAAGITLVLASAAVTVL